MLSTRYIGWCPVCERDIKVRGGVLVHHGYQRPGIGYIVGDCPGVGHLPYESGTDAADFYLESVVQPNVDRVHHNLQVLTRPEGPPWLVFEHYDVERGRVIRDPRTGVPETIRLNRSEADRMRVLLPTYEAYRFSWTRQLEIAIAQAESEFTFWNREKNRITRLIETWTPQPLRTIEQEIERKEQSRAERESARTSARDKKITDEVIKIRKRIDAAVRNKNSATLADIYKSRKLVDLSGYRITDTNAISLLERDNVWRAFGLLTHEGYLTGAAAKDVLEEMTWGRRVPPPPNSGLRFDYAPLPWPAELGGGTAKTR